MGVELPAMSTIRPAVAWHVPSLLPENPDTPPPQVNSKEKVVQTTRMVTITGARYSSEYSVPSNPIPLSDVEQALDMTSQASTVTQTIPFFVPQAPVPAPVAAATLAGGALGATTYPLTPAQAAPGIATAETVQSLGLPMFLVGQSTQALQTLASTPSLLNTYVDSNGMYDQARLINLVQTLSQGSGSGASAPGYPQSVGASTGAYGQPPGTAGMYGASASQTAYGSSYGAGGIANGGYRGTQNTTEANLHLSGYGPSTTQAEIIALFSPYVHVTEVVIKGTFCFVNTVDPAGAQRAREALNGALLGGQPVRINMATRKAKEPTTDLAMSAIYGSQPAVAAGGLGLGQPPLAQVPGQSLAMGGDVSHVRDDRGNPATKNLFVAGYGHGTSEEVLRQVFSPHCEIVGIINKGTFSFINTADKRQAVQAREMLGGTMLNGGVIRINFAKETGRLGTSFDLTYGNNAPPMRSQYGPQGY
jgi:RNA recognition motif-containing protein